MTALLLIASTAFAQQSYGDPLTERAPNTFFASVAGARIADGDKMVFGDVDVGIPVYRAKNAAFGLGVVGQVQTASVHTPSGQSFSGIRSAGADLWLSFGSNRPGTVHGFFLGYHGPLSDASSMSWFQVTPNETTARLKTGYDGYIDAKGYDVSIQALIGGGEALALDWSLTGLLLFDIGDTLSIGGGTTLGALPFQTAVASARWRPVYAVELGVGVGVPFAIASHAPYPILELTVLGW